MFLANAKAIADKRKQEEESMDDENMSLSLNSVNADFKAGFQSPRENENKLTKLQKSLTMIGR